MSATIAVLAKPANNVLTPMVVVSPIKGAYVQHPHTSARNFPQIQSAFGTRKAGETTPCLVSDARITPLDPLDFFMTGFYAQYNAEQNSLGEYVTTYPITAAAPKGVKECIDSVVICIIPADADGAPPTFVPARMRLKAGKCRLLTSAYDRLAEMQLTDKKLQTLTKLGLEPYNLLHFTAAYETATAKVSKKPYVVGIAEPEQTTPDLAKALLAVMKTPDFIAAYNVCVDGYNETLLLVQALGNW